MKFGRNFILLFTLLLAFSACKTRNEVDYNGGKVTVRNMNGPDLSSVEVAKDLGDDFDLQGALVLLEGCQSPQEFERKLNTTDGISNLDLNGDDVLDFVSVREFKDGNTRGYSLSSEGKYPIANLYLDVKTEADGTRSVSTSIEGDPYMYSSNTRYDGPSTGGTTVINNNYGNQGGHDSGMSDFLETVILLSLIDDIYDGGGYGYGHRPSYYSHRSYRSNYTRYSTVHKTTVNKTVTRNNTAKTRRTNYKSPNSSMRAKAPSNKTVRSGKAATQKYKKSVSASHKSGSYSTRSKSKSVGSGGFGNSKTSKKSTGSSWWKSSGNSSKSSSRSSKPSRSSSRKSSSSSRRSSGRRRR